MKNNKRNAPYRFKPLLCTSQQHRTVLLPRDDDLTPKISQSQGNITTVDSVDQNRST